MPEYRIPEYRIPEFLNFETGNAKFSFKKIFGQIFNLLLLASSSSIAIEAVTLKKYGN
jgi:hypothetical protein